MIDYAPSQLIISANAGTVVAYEVTQQAPFGVGGGFLTFLCLYRALDLDWTIH